MPDGDERKKRLRWGLKSESRYVLEASLDLAKSINPVRDDGQKWDANPWLLGVANGIVDLRTGKLREAQPGDRVTLYSPVAFDDTAACPRFEQFMLEIFHGDINLVRFMQRAIGYSLIGVTDEQCLFVCYGTGANGKSTLLGVLHYILGDYAVNVPFSALEKQGRSNITNDLAMLSGRRFATALETGEDVRLNEARIKTVTGGDPITARYLYHEHFTFNPTHKLWLAVNHKPRILDESEGMWRRVRMIPFETHFSGTDRDDKLPEKLRAEAPGILAWAVRGAQEWQRDGLGEPTAVAAATAAYRQESDHLEDFQGEYCVIDAKASVTTAALWAEYQRWTSGAGIEPLSRTAFTERLRQRGFKEERFGHAGTRGWRGLRLANADAEAVATSYPVERVAVGGADTQTQADTISDNSCTTQVI